MRRQRQGISRSARGGQEWSGILCAGLLAGQVETYRSRTPFTFHHQPHVAFLNSVASSGDIGAQFTA